MEQQSNSTAICEELRHVICLPFRLRDNGPSWNIDLDKTEGFLANSSWKTCHASLLDDPDEPWDQLRRYQAKAYFHPFVRRFLYDSKSVRRFRRADVGKVRIVLDHWSLSTRETVELLVPRCELVLFQPDIGLLLLETQAQSPLPLNVLHLLLDGFRRLYPPYIDCFETEEGECWSGGHCPVSVVFLNKKGQQIGETGRYRSECLAGLPKYRTAPDESPPVSPWAEHWRSLLEPFDCSATPAPGLLGIESLGDDRAPILSWMAMDDPRKLNRGNWMRLCFADSPGSDALPYAEKFITEFEDKFCYDRFWYEPGESGDTPSRLLNCGYAFSFVGKNHDPYFFTNEKNGAHATFRNIYVEMGVIAHFQQAALLAASQRLSGMVHRDGGQICLPDPKEVRRFYEHFVEFTQTFWFDEITPQEQGRELFQMWRTHLRIQELYDEARQELKDLVEYTEMQAANKLNHNLSWVAIVGLLIAFFSLLASVFGMNPIKPGGLDDLTAAGLVTSLCMFLILIALAIKLLPFQRTHKKTGGKS